MKLKLIFLALLALGAKCDDPVVLKTQCECICDERDSVEIKGVGISCEDWHGVVNVYGAPCTWEEE